MIIFIEGDGTSTHTSDKKSSPIVSPPKDSQKSNGFLGKIKKVLFNRWWNAVLQVIFL